MAEAGACPLDQKLCLSGNKEVWGPHMDEPEDDVCPCPQHCVAARGVTEEVA